MKYKKEKSKIKDNYTFYMFFFMLKFNAQRKIVWKKILGIDLASI